LCPLERGPYQARTTTSGNSAVMGPQPVRPAVLRPHLSVRGRPFQMRLFNSQHSVARMMFSELRLRSCIRPAGDRLLEFAGLRFKTPIGCLDSKFSIVHAISNMVGATKGTGKPIGITKRRAGGG
jgi:hypothetical protein